MISLTQFRIEYDDTSLDIIDKVNEVLEQYGFRLEHDNQDHDGFDIYTLTLIKK